MAISSFALQLNGVNFSQVANSSFDLFITEGAPNPVTQMPGFTQLSDTQVAQLRAQGRLVAGYVNVAVTDDARYYWNPVWTANGTDRTAPTQAAPNWLKNGIPIDFDSTMPGFDAYVVDFQDADWQTIVIDQAKELLRRGYSGIFLDDVGRYFRVGADEQANRVRATAMAEFVARIDAEIRSVRADAFLVVNADPYLTTNVTANAQGSAARDAYLAAVDAYVFENLDAAAIDHGVNVTLTNRTRLIVESDGSPAFTPAENWARGILYTSPTNDYTQFSDVAHFVTDGNDVINGGDGPNRIESGAGNDILSGGRQSDLLDGGTGFDEARYSGVRKTYRITTAAQPGGVATQVAFGIEGGTDTLRNVEQARFTDGVLSFDPAGSAAKVLRIYNAALQRGPDPSGYEFWLGQLNGGFSLNAMASVFADSGEFAARFGSLGNQQFIEQLYQFTLGRAGDGGGIGFWTGQLNSSARSRGDVLAEFSESGEHLVRTGDQLAQGLWIADQQARVAARMYDSALGRLPDSSGLGFWTGQLKSGTSVIDMANAFASGPEFQSRFGSLSNQQFVEQLYLFTLGRPADGGGLQFWTGFLNNGGSRGQMLAEFSEGAEHVNKTAALWYGGISIIDGTSQSASSASVALDNAANGEAEWQAALAAIGTDPIASDFRAAASLDEGAFITPAEPNLPDLMFHSGRNFDYLMHEMMV